MALYGTGGAPEKAIGVPRSMLIGARVPGRKL